MVESNSDILDVGEHVGGGAGSLRQRIDLDALAIGHGLRDIGFAVAGQVRADQRIAAPGARPKRGIALGDLVLVVGRQHQELDAFALVHAQQPRILERHLPDVDDIGV